jgi:hypothetical protein
MLPVGQRKDQYTLAEVHQLFEQWRREKRRRDPIPPGLWDAAVALSRKHSINEISKHLHLSYNELKARANNPKPVPFTPNHPAFIEFAALSCVECTIELERPTGERMRIKGSCSVTELARDFWKA